MKQIEKVSAATNYTAVSVGKMNELGAYELQLGPEVKIPGKVFGGAGHGRRVLFSGVPAWHGVRFPAHAQGA